MKDQIWWVTGASSGIGAALARGLAGRGARLILSGRNVAALEAVAKDCGPGTMILPFEATDYAALPTLVQEAWDWCGRIDGLVNNAGISQRSLAIDTDFSVYQKIVDVDLLAPIALTQQLLPRMIEAGGGHIVAISSVAGILGAPLRSAYSAAKHGLIGYHDSVRVENEHRGLKVLVVAPGSVRTNVSRNALNADGSTRGTSDAVIENGMSPEDAATQILGAIAAEKREIVVAEGAEADMARLRRADPDALFDRMSATVQAGLAAQLKTGE
ncbi:SDR family NAD(P)-dependent oxidoreductase [Sphingopyxis sp. 550A]|jgi:short-subunit dehydrogenase